MTEPNPDAEGEEGDADTDDDDGKPKRRSGIARLKRQLEIERAENAAPRSRAPTMAVDSESIARAVEAARKGIGSWISYYNEMRLHSSHGLRTPAEAYDSANGNLKAAA